MNTNYWIFVCIFISITPALYVYLKSLKDRLRSKKELILVEKIGQLNQDMYRAIDERREKERLFFEQARNDLTRELQRLRSQ